MNIPASSVVIVGPDVPLTTLNSLFVADIVTV